MFRIHESGSDSESFVLAEFKNTNFIKIGGTKNVHGSNSRGTSRTQRPSTNFFFRVVISWKVEYFWKVCIRKVIYVWTVWTNNLKLFSYSEKSILGPSIFSKFQLWSQIRQWSSINFVFKFQLYNLQLITFPKHYLESTSTHWNWRYHQFYVKKRVKSTKIHIAFSSNFTRFLT